MLIWVFCSLDGTRREFFLRLFFPLPQQRNSQVQVKPWLSEKNQRDKKRDRIRNGLHEKVLCTLIGSCWFKVTKKILCDLFGSAVCGGGRGSVGVKVAFQWHKQRQEQKTVWVPWKMMVKGKSRRGARSSAEPNQLYVPFHSTVTQNVSILAFHNFPITVFIQQHEEKMIPILFTSTTTYYVTLQF